MNDGTRDVARFIADAIEDARDGELAPERLEEVRRLLLESSHARMAYLKYNHFGHLLACSEPPLRAAESSALLIANDNAAQPGRKMLRSRWVIGIACMAMAALLILPALKTPSQVPIRWENRSLAGSLAKSQGGLLKVPDLDLELQEGQEVRVGDYLLAAGFVEMDLDGVKLTFESPAQFRIVSDEHILLKTGRLTARVPENKQQFQVETTEAGTAQILPGTETAIQADKDVSEIHVFDGNVDVLPKAEEIPVHLTRAKATRIGRRGSPAGVDFDSDRFVRHLLEPASDYAALIRQLDPVIYFRMGSSPDCVTLPNEARESGPADDVAIVYPGEMKRPPIAPGKIGSSLRLQAEFGSYAIYSRYPSAESQLTVCAWVRASSRPRWASIAKQWSKNVGQFHFGLHGDTGELEILVLDEDGKKVRVRDESPFPLRAWQFVAFVVDGSTLRLYLNGNEIGAKPCNGLSPAGSSNVGIGVKLGDKQKPARNSTGFWDGRIDELAIFHHALSADDIKRLFETGMTDSLALASIQSDSDNLNGVVTLNTRPLPTDGQFAD